MFFLTNDRLIRHCMEREVGKGRERKKNNRKISPKQLSEPQLISQQIPGMETVDSGYKTPMMP